MEVRKIFSGSSYSELAEKVCKILGVKLSSSKTYTYNSTGCFERQLQENVKGKNVYLFQTAIPNLCDNHLLNWEGLEMIDAASLNGAENITLVVSYVPYARSDKVPGDKKFLPGTNINAQLLIRCWQIAGVNRVVVVEPHSKRFTTFFNSDSPHYKLYRFTTPYEIDPTDLIASEIKPEIAKNPENSILITPDEGAFDRNEKLQKILGIRMLCAEKDRKRDAPVQSIRKNWGVEDTEGKDIYFRDDEISSADTVKGTLNGLKANKTIVIATHGVFSEGALKNLQQIENLERIIVTDTLPISKPIKNAFPLKIISVAGLIAQAIIQIEKEIKIN